MIRNIISYYILVTPIYIYTKNFEIFKLSTKVRERLKVAIERVHGLEIELNTKIEENVSLKAQLTSALSEAEKLSAQVSKT